MQHIRTIKPELFQHEDLAEVSFPARLLFVGLFTCADREGRLEDRPRRLKAQLFPYDADVDVDALLSELASLKMIRRYVVDDRDLIDIPGFKKHQRIGNHEPPSDLPPCPDPAPGRFSTLKHAEARVSPLRSASVEGKGREGNSGGREGESEGKGNARGWRRVPPHEQLTPERLEAGRIVSGLFGSEVKQAWGAFMDHEFARPKHDVDATWRNWCRKEKPHRAAPKSTEGLGRDEAQRLLRGLAGK